jgi:uncharacterized protein (TIGR01777 family)
MIIAITGASGLVGQALTAALEADGHLVRPVVRRAARPEKNEIAWDPDKGSIDAAEFEKVDAVVHLAGENIAAQRWTLAFKKRLVESRTRSTKLLCDALAALPAKPSTLISASAIGYYGDRGVAPIDESSPPGTGFAADLCQQWEAATQSARDAGIRVVNLRIGVVLAREGGAFVKMLTPFKLGVGGVIGSGQQYVSWIVIDDLIRAIKFLLSASAVSGPVNATAPNPATNRELTKTLGRVVRRPTIFPMPAFAARLAFGEFADEMLLAGANIKPLALTAAGFQFEYPQLEPALKHILE